MTFYLLFLSLRQVNYYSNKQSEMKKVSITPKATLVAQVQAGTSVSAVIDDSGLLYLPVIDINSILGDTAPFKTEASVPQVKAPAKKSEPKKAAPKKAEAKTVTKILEEIDEGTIDEGDELKELKKVVKHGDDFLNEMIDKFFDNPDIPIEDIAKEIEAGPTKEEKKEEPKKKPARKKAEAKEEPKKEEKAEEPTKKEGEEVSADDLVVGDKVDVYWEEYKESYTGVVEKIMKGKRYVKYDEDGEVEVIDPKEHTKIVFLG